MTANRVQQTPSPLLGHAYLNALEDIHNSEWKLYEFLADMFPTDYLNDIAGDTYDCSAELYFGDKVPHDWTLSPEQSTAIRALGFAQFWANFHDNTEQFNGGERHPVGRDRKRAKREDRIRQLEIELAGLRERVEWIAVGDRLPEDSRNVLAHFLNSGGKHRIVRAFYAKQYSIEDNSDNDEGYEEKDGTGYIKEGWYEHNENEEFYWFIHEEVTDWQPLPEPPRALLPAPPAGKG